MRNKTAKVCCGQCEYFGRQFTEKPCNKCEKTGTMIAFKLSRKLKVEGYKVEFKDYLRQFIRLFNKDSKFGR